MNVNQYNPRNQTCVAGEDPDPRSTGSHDKMKFRIQNPQHLTAKPPRIQDPQDSTKKRIQDTHDFSANKKQYPGSQDPTMKPKKLIEDPRDLTAEQTLKIQDVQRLAEIRCPAKSGASNLVRPPMSTMLSNRL